MSRISWIGWTSLALWSLLAALLAWFVLEKNPAFFWQPDSDDYHIPALHLMEGQGFTNAAGELEVFRTPGLSLLLAGIYAVFGIKAWPVIFAQLLLVTATAFLVGNLAASTARERGLPNGPAFLAAALSTLFSPVLLIGSMTLMSEILFTALSMAAGWLLARGMDDARPLAVLCGMALITASAFVRPVSLYLPPALLLATAPFLWRRRSAAMAAAVILGLVLHLAAVRGWSQRNAEAAGEPVFATVQHVNLYLYVAASIEAKALGIGWNELSARYMATLEKVPPDRRQHFMRTSAIDVIAAHPLTAAHVWLRGATVLGLQPSTGQFATLLGLREPGSGIIYHFVSMPLREFSAHVWKHERSLILLIALGLPWLLPFWTLAGAGVLLCLRGARASTFILLGQAAYFVLVSSGPQTVDRFRAPIIPLCAIFLGVAVAWLLRGTRTQNE